jgi:O-methyltransferase involved in polyketide biosynthesis
MDSRQKPQVLDPTDRPIVATAEDAILAKQACVLAGYYQDPFLDPFCRHSIGVTASSATVRRRQFQPIIKRGTHARVCCMDRAIAAFLNLTSQHAKLQIVVLGAGKDTTYFRYRAGLLTDKKTDLNIEWYEVDHPSVINDKAKTIEGSPTLLLTAMHLTNHGYRMEDSSSTYHLIGHDLRESPQQLLEKLALDQSAPTLVLLECVLMYIPDDSSQLLLQSLSTCVDDILLCAYEPILGNDPFGTMMEQNLLKAGVATSSSCLVRTRTLASQLQKVIAGGFSVAVACDMWSAYETIITNDQRRRANQCEFLDEVEEWILIMRHYCFVAAHGGTRAASGNQFCRVGPESPLGFVTGKCQIATDKNDES